MKQQGSDGFRKARVELTTIIDEALRLLDEKGLEGVTTRALAARLGIAGPSLYWHVRNKQELFSHMAEAMFMANLPKAETEGQSWQEWLSDGARCIRDAALSHRDGARIIAASHPTATIDALSFPAMVKRLTDEGFSRSQALNAFLVMGRFTIGWALAEQMEGGPEENQDPAVGYDFGLQIIVRGLERELAAGRA